MALTLTFRNGRTMNGLLWSVPENGTFKALNEKNGQIKEYKLGDIKSGIVYPTRDRHEEAGEDFLAKIW